MRKTLLIKFVLSLTGGIGLFSSPAWAHLPSEEMVWIPKGEFIMGSDQKEAQPNERPSHRVWVDGFWMDKTAVTNAQFAQFVKATGYKTTAERPVDWNELKKQVPAGTPPPPPQALQPGSLVFTPPPHEVDLRDLSGWWTWTPGASWKHPEGPESNLKGREKHPVVQVSWDDAVAYAKWAGKRLPTEAEWEYAARGGLSGKRFAWGNEFKPQGKYLANIWTGKFPLFNTAEDGYPGIAPVKSFPPNGYGLYDMAGNVWNWCSDFYREDNHQQNSKKKYCINPQGPANSHNSTRPVTSTVEHVVKGGSFLCEARYCESYRPSARRGIPTDTGSQHVGFRCVK